MKWNTVVVVTPRPPTPIFIDLINYGCDDVMQSDLCDVTQCPPLHCSTLFNTVLHCYLSMVFLSIFKSEHMGEHMV